MTPKWLIDRRTALRGAGIAVALPMLDVMARPGRAQAAPPRRFVTWFQPGGTVMNAWRPKNSETELSLAASPILAPLDAHRKDLIVLEGLDYAVARTGTGHPHYQGLAAFLTGHVLPPGKFAQVSSASTGWAQGPSIDQIVAAQIGGDTKLRSLELAVRWPTAKTGPDPSNIIWYAGPDKPIAPMTDPRQIFDRLFKDLAAPGATPAGEPRARRRARSILDSVAREYQLFAARTSADDRRKIDAHLTSVRELEKSLDSLPAAPATVAGCAAPPPPNLAAFAADDAQPAAGKVIADLLVMALACDLTRVAGYQWADPMSRNRFPFLSLPGHHHEYQHDEGYDSAACTKICTFYAGQLAYLLQRLSDTREGDRRLLDSTLVLAGSEINVAPTHSLTSVPLLLAGGGGGFKTGRHVKWAGVPHNNLLVSIQNAFGIPGSSFGKPGIATGPLANL